ncbi:MAG TPA: DUF3300 domain-containing protein [Candidatus Acidoferrales bacterium]|nr:DUF3300 domain-containing protein [Candidatus Acidoferrales bacterium]
MKNNPVILSLVSAAVLFLGPAAAPVKAQLAVPPPMPAYQPLSDAQLDQLLGPIALYPDPLLAEILPASTLPTEIVLADRYVASGGDPTQIYQQPWDPSVQALAQYPAVLQYLDDNLAWTTAVGQAFLYQQQQVMDSIQRLRLSAQNFGNLVSTPQEQVVEDDGCIEILPVDPNTMYVPIYQPDSVFYQAGFPLAFGVGCAIGPWLCCDFNWHQHQLFYWGRNHPRPANWWREQPAQRAAWLAGQGTVWRPEDHGHRGASTAGDRGWNRQPAALQPRNNSVAWMPRPAATPRPEATPRPAAEPRPAVRETGGFHVENPNVGAGRGAFIGSDSSREVRDDSNRGGQSMQAVERSEPARSEPARSEPAHVEAPPAPAENHGSKR